MSKIKVLSEQVSNKIAAGEVIERPCSIVKELVENSIDAAADKIEVRTMMGGKRGISVTDNGHGMNSQDLLLAFERHATSKIATEEDIFCVNSLGFRGEALPSIASVARVEMISKSQKDLTANKIIFNFGTLKAVEKCSGNTGTTVKISSLFLKVPARRKFLKSTQVEYRHILNYLHQQTIVHPHIHFTLYHNDRKVFDYPAVNSAEKRIKLVFGSKFTQAEFIPVDSFDSSAVAVRGFIGNFEKSLPIFPNLRYLFINGRFIKNGLVYHAIAKGYEPIIKKFGGKVPPFILFLQVDPKLVDFNVHPAKQEVRFVDTALVYRNVNKAVNFAYLAWEKKKFDDLQERVKESLAPLQENEKQILHRLQKGGSPALHSEAEQLDIFGKKVEEDFSPEEKSPAQTVTQVVSELSIINPWQLHQSYIFIQDEHGLLAIDQHAAHERILYEQVLQRLNGAAVVTQNLAFPIVVDLPGYLAAGIQETVRENKELFAKAGIFIKEFSGNSVVVQEVPTELKDWNSAEFFIAFFEDLEQRLKKQNNFRENLAASIACKAAIKAGQKMSRPQMLNLINDLFATQVPYFCPHGRPTIIKVPISDLEKMFKRT